MVEYTIETLVHLYDSLNDQISAIIIGLTDFDKICVDPSLSDHYRDVLKEEHKAKEDRLKRLNVMRDNLEKLIGRILMEETK